MPKSRYFTTAPPSTTHLPAGCPPAPRENNLEGRRPRLPINRRGPLSTLRQPLPNFANLYQAIWKNRSGTGSGGAVNQAGFQASPPPPRSKP